MIFLIFADFILFLNLQELYNTKLIGFGFF